MKILNFFCVLSFVALLEPVLSLDCPDEWTADPKTGNCYRVLTDETNWEGSKTKCEATPRGELASIRSQAEWDYVEGILNEEDNIAHIVWIGGKKVSRSWEWTDGSSFSRFSAWDREIGDQKCIRVKKETNHRTWKDDNCNGNHRALCKIPACEVGWVINPNSGDCYFISKESENWVTAEYKCRSLDSHLAILDSSEKDEFITEQLINSKSSTHGWWLGAQDIDHSFKFLWIDGTEMESYKNWQKGQPDNFDGKEHCLMKLAKDNDEDMKWNDYSCYEELPYICAK